MTDTKDISTETQANDTYVAPKTTCDTSNVVDIESNVEGHVEYDVSKVDEFLGVVFHYGYNDNEHTLAYASSKSSPGYPSSHESFNKRIRRTNKPLACYYSTATSREDEEDGRLYNRQMLFESLRVVVLDDVGTKVPVDKIPDTFKPTYIIESSPGNFQYGYVLESPLDSLELSKALIQAVYNSGLTDGGGAMPNKLVRLPCGVNGKQGDNRLFPVTLIHSDGPLWTPNAIMDEIDTGITWPQVVEDAGVVGRSKGSKLGGSAWSSHIAKGMTTDGIVDPLLEYLYEEGEVVNEGPEWFDVICPWKHTHTGGGDTAGYSPVGYGSGKHKDMRAFNCFHDHCKEQDTASYLEHMAVTSGIEVPIYDPAATLVRDYLYNNVNNSVIDLTGSRPLEMKLEGFNNTFNKVVEVYLSDGKTKRIALSRLWMNAPHRVNVVGDMSDFSCNDQLVQHGGHNYCNAAQMPSWGDGPYNQRDIDRFLEFIHYLIPCNEEHEYFLEWLSAKAQNPEFRGCGILMATEGLQGTGRTTLGSMISDMFGRHNTTNISIGDMISGSFNEWQAGLFTVTNETLSSIVAGGDSDTSKQVHKVYEALKDIIDPTPIDTVINRKYGTKMKVRCVTSTLMFSNHGHALATADGDRRVYVIQNTNVLWSQEQFSRLHHWIGQKSWARSVFRWLRTRTVDLKKMNGYAPMTEGKMAMTVDTESTINYVVKGLLDEMHVDGMVTLRGVKRVLTEARVADKLGLGTHYKNYATMLNRAITNAGASVRLPACAKLSRRSTVEGGNPIKWTGRVLKTYAKEWASDIHETAVLSEATPRMLGALHAAIDKCENYDDMVELALHLIDEKEND